MTDQRTINIAIVGAGLVGLTTALGLSANGISSTLFAPDFETKSHDGGASKQDGRSTALLADTYEYISQLVDVFELENISYPLKTMRIIDDTNRLIRAPQSDFNAAEIGLPAFGYNVLNSDLAGLLKKHIKRSDLINVVEHGVTNAEYSDQTTKLQFDDGTSKHFDCVLACDGRNSFIRQSYGIEFETAAYPQVAVVGNIAHQFAHNNTSTEFHTKTGPCTLVPLDGKTSSFVCVVTEEIAEQLSSLNTDVLNRELEDRFHSILGKFEIKSKLQKFPLTISKNRIYAKDNLILLGESAHVLPPIGAQGFNIGIRDIKTIVSLLSSNTLNPTDIADRYQKSRLGDVKSRSVSVDLLNRSLLSDFLPTQIARSFGLYAISNFAPLRKFAMKEGIQPGRGLRDLLSKNFSPKADQSNK